MIEKYLERLMQRSSYAKFKDVSVETVRVWIRTGKIKPVLIDGKDFIELNDEEFEKLKNKK
ncbi:MAG: hypothetical protein ACRCXV_09365 [Bacteroidales bacterium]